MAPAAEAQPSVLACGHPEMGVIAGLGFGVWGLGFGV